MKLRTFVCLVLTVFAVALAVMVVNRISSESLAMLLGIACGICATVPISAFALWVARRPRQDGRTQAVQRSYPPVVVLSPGSPGRHSMPPAYYPPPPAPAEPPRRYNVIGDDDMVFEDCAGEVRRYIS